MFGDYKGPHLPPNNVLKTGLSFSRFMFLGEIELRGPGSLYQRLLSTGNTTSGRLLVSRLFHFVHPLSMAQ